AEDRRGVDRPGIGEGHVLRLGARHSGHAHRRATGQRQQAGTQEQGPERPGHGGRATVHPGYGVDSNHRAAMPPAAGTLSGGATPIGNLGDLSPRALDTLREVAAICAEDTRRTRQLLSYFGVERPLLALHEHNEEAMAERLVERLAAGDSLALVSDAGT